jgi:hypothetical protein
MLHARLLGIKANLVVSNKKMVGYYASIQGRG